MDRKVNILALQAMARLRGEPEYADLMGGFDDAAQGVDALGFQSVPSNQPLVSTVGKTLKFRLHDYGVVNARWEP